MAKKPAAPAAEQEGRLAGVKGATGESVDPTILINERVDVAVLYRKQGNMSTLCYPYKMKYQGQEITFTELCLRHPTSKGRRMVHVFDMSDGTNDYRLEFDAENLTWALVAMLEGST